VPDLSGHARPAHRRGGHHPERHREGRCADRASHGEMPPM